MIVVHYGGGTNSAALVLGLKEHGLRPDLILFADTVAEKPHTYAHIFEMNQWCKQNEFPEITTVRFKTKDGVELTLEQDCLKRNSLPGIAYGFKSCSERFKIRPQNAFLKQFPLARETWARGGKVTKLIGYDAGEVRRAKNYGDLKFKVQYPLIEWGWHREDCLRAIARSGLTLPGKSACFFCPSSKKAEVKELAERYPELYKRAVDMETNANLASIKGLGRTWSWKQFVGGDAQEIEIGLPCECFEGEE